MISGRDALHRIDGAIAEARQSLSRVSDAATAGAARLADIERVEGDAYRRLAVIRIGVLQSDKNFRTIGAVDEKAERLIAEHEHYLNDLSSRLRDAKGKIEGLEADRRRQEENVATAIAAHDEAAALTHTRLESDETYQQKADALEEANAIAQRAAKKLDLAGADREQKGAPYERDPLFSYLWKRKFGAKEYKAFFLYAALDRWVSGLIKYRDARLNYMRLLELPERLAEHAARVDEAAAQIEADIEAYERAALEKDGVTRLRDNASAAQAELEKIDAAIAEAEASHEKLVRENADAAAGREGPLKQAHALLADALSGYSIPDLSVLAAETTTPEDDRIVEELIRLKRERMEIEENRHGLTRAIDRQGRVLSDIGKLRRQFKSARYDSPYSEFSDSGVIGVVLGELLRGALSYGDAWRRMQRSQRIRRRDWSGDFGGDEWRGGFGLPQDWGRSGGGNWGGGWGGGKLPRPTRSPGRVRIPRAPRMPRPRGGGGFKTGGGF